MSYLYHKCVLCGKRRMPNSNVSLFRFPLDPDRCRLWVKFLGNEDLVHVAIENLHERRFVCGSHFSQDSLNSKGNRLKKSAIPTMNLPHLPLTDEILKDFPLHLRYKKPQKQVLKSGPLMECTNINIQKNHSSMLSKVANLSDKENVEDHTPTSTVVHVSTSDFVPLASSSKASEHLTFKRNKDCTASSNIINLSTDDLIPIASSSKAPEHLTFRRNTVQTAFKMPEATVLVQNYKRSKSCNETKDITRHLTEREKRLLKKLQNTKVTVKKLASSSLNLDKIDSDVLKSIVMNALANQKKRPHGKRWGLKNKITSLAIYKRSPKAYRYMQKVLPLPSERTLQRMLKELHIQPGIYDNILNNLTHKTSQLEDQDKYCAILFDEIALKKRLIYNEFEDKVEGFVDHGPGEGMERTNQLADHALVFMIQGLRFKFKQPIGHYFVEGTISSQKLASIIKTVIKKITETGFKVVTVVCDQGPTNVGAINLLKHLCNLDREKNYFMTEGEKINIIYDIPHLFKSLRNNFYNAGFIKFNGKLGQWSHLKKAEERNRSFLNFNKLTPLVVNPNFKIKMKVKYAAHALSNTMAAVLKMMAWRDDNAEAIGETAYVVEQLDKLFDCTNGPASSKDIKKGIRENVSEKTNHVASWNYYLQVMQTLKFINATTFKESKNVRCIKGFQISLNSLKDIWNLLNKAGFKYLNLRQLNQDSLENLFGNIRQHSVTNKNPTCSHFTAALKSCIISGLTGPHSRGSNCEADSNELFMTFVELNRLSRKEESKSDKQANLLEEIEIGYHSKDFCYPVLSLPEDPTIEEYELDLYSFEDQPVVYVSGYLAAKLLNKSTCINCKQFLSIDDPKDDDLYNYVSFREWWQNKRSLTYPSKKLCKCVNDAKKYYEATLSKRIHKLNIGQECCLQLNINCDFAWFRCQKHYVEVTENLIRSLSNLFIRKSCKIINDQYKVTESELAAKKKLMQQQRMEANK